MNNPDGSYNVYCRTCGDFIAATFVCGLASAQCELCARIEKGEVIPPEVLKEYMLSKSAKADISMLLVPDEPVVASKRFTLAGMGGLITEALQFLKKEKPPAPASVKIAKQKQRGRLFSNVSLGSMEELDKASKK